MTQPPVVATRYPEINSVLQELLSGVRAILDRRFVGMLYTIRHGAIVTKPVAARWAQEALDRRWTPLVRDALAWSRDVPPDLNETLAYIRYTCEYGDHMEASVGSG